MGKQLQHIPGPGIGRRCRRCGLSYSPKTAYVRCFEEGDTRKTWLARQHPEVRKVIEKHSGVSVPETT